MKVQNSKLKVKSYSLKLKLFFKFLNFAFCIVILHSALCTLHLPRAHAEGTSLKMQPSNLQIRAKSPSDIQAPFTLTNQGSEPVNLQVVLKTFRDTGDDTGRIVYSKPGLKNEAEQDSFLKTVQILDDGFAVSKITLGPKQQKKLELRINLPKDSKAQDHYFSIIFLTEPDVSSEISESENSSSAIQSGIALPVLLAVNTTSEPSGFLDEFSGPILLQTGPVPFTVKVENTGEHFVEARGLILIKNMFGQTVGKIELPKTNILSGSKRQLITSSARNSSSSVTGALWEEQFLLGFYTATLTLVVAPDQSLYTRSVHFFAFPAVGFAFVFGALIIGIFIVRRVKKKVSQ